jgi:hypothetical protein
MKDRQRELLLDDGKSRIVIRRSSSHPVEYAIVLVHEYDGADRTVRSYDNAHAVDEHHEHRYIRTEKQPPTITDGTVNDAMASALRRLRQHWRAYVDEWKGTVR